MAAEATVEEAVTPGVATVAVRTPVTVAAVVTAAATKPKAVMEVRVAMKPKAATAAKCMLDSLAPFEIHCTG
jgi:hypothetical protein